jgi:hypothetical protein
MLPESTTAITLPSRMADALLGGPVGFRFDPHEATDRDGTIIAPPSECDFLKEALMYFTRNSRTWIGCLAVVFALWLPTAASAQYGYGDRDRDRATEIERGATIPVRTDQPIDAERSDNRVYTGVVDQDVRGDDGRLAIPRGSTAELMVRIAPDNDLVLDLNSVIIDGQRYTVRANTNRQEAEGDNSVVGSIMGAINGQARGREIRIPRDSVLTFRLERPLIINNEPSHGYGGPDYP